MAYQVEVQKKMLIFLMNFSKGENKGKWEGCYLNTVFLVWVFYPKTIS
jgi:hypothetical protein